MELSLVFGITASILLELNFMAFSRLLNSQCNKLTKVRTKNHGTKFFSLYIIIFICYSLPPLREKKEIIKTKKEISASLLIVRLLPS